MKLSRSVLRKVGRSVAAGVGLWSLCNAPLVGAQDKPATTAEQAIDNAKKAYGPPPPKPKCAPVEGDEIVVCAEEQEQSQFRVKSSSELDPTSEEAIKDGLPRAPDFSESCKKNPEKGVCMGFGSVPPPALIIDVTALPEAPPGSDADRISRGLPPLGAANRSQQNTKVLPQPDDASERAGSDEGSSAVPSEEPEL